MSSRAQIPWETRLGNAAVLQIMSLLARFSNPIEYRVDPGLDLYSELIENDVPSTQFFVQAKGTEHFDDTWGQSIKKSTIRYWLDQPFPVFLIVYDEVNKKCYWMSIEDMRYSLVSKMKSPEETIYLKMDRSRTLEPGKGANVALIRKIREDLLSIDLSRGVARFKGNEYVKQIPMSPRTQPEVTLLEHNVRANLYSLIQHYETQVDFQRIYDACSFLARFDKWHYNHFVWLGVACINLRRRDEAIRSFNEALKICEMDKTWPRESMEKIKEGIRALAQIAEKRPA